MTFDQLSIGDAFLDLNGEWHRKVPTSIGQNAVTANGAACIFSPNYPVRPVANRGDS